MIKIADIAKKMNLSKATVSNALTGTGRMKPTTRAAVIKCAEESGYVPTKRSNKQPKKKMIVITEDIRITFVSHILEGIRKEAVENNLYLPIYNLGILDGILNREGYTIPKVSVLNRAVTSILDTIDETVTGIIYVSQYPRPINGLMDDISIPSVCVLCTRSDGAPFVHYDDRQGAYLAVETLIRSGCRHIAMISGQIDSIGMIHRTNGYQRALVDHGLVFDPSLLKIGDWKIASGYEITKSLLTEGKTIDSIFAQNDSMAIGAMHAISEANLSIPGDISVVGFDNSYISSVCIPTLSSLAPPYEKMGHTALRTLLAINDKKKPDCESIFIPCELVHRNSTRCNE